jgi:26S proteasome regulatory subunit N5
VTRVLADMKEKEDKIGEAADVLQELQVETFGSMEKREKTDFFLEQMRLCLLKGDLVRSLIISRKIGTKFFSDEANTDLKLRYYELMIKLGTRENRYLDVCKYYRHVFDTKQIKEDDAQWPLVPFFFIFFFDGFQFC